MEPSAIYVLASFLPSLSPTLSSGIFGLSPLYSSAVAAGETKKRAPRNAFLNATEGREGGGRSWQENGKRRDAGTEEGAAEEGGKGRGAAHKSLLLPCIRVSPARGRGAVRVVIGSDIAEIPSPSSLAPTEPGPRPHPVGAFYAKKGPCCDEEKGGQLLKSKKRVWGTEEYNWEETITFRSLRSCQRQKSPLLSSSFYLSLSPFARFETWQRRRRQRGKRKVDRRQGMEKDA